MAWSEFAVRTFEKCRTDVLFDHIFPTRVLHHISKHSSSRFRLHPHPWCISSESCQFHGLRKLRFLSQPLRRPPGRRPSGPSPTRTAAGPAGNDSNLNAARTVTATVALTGTADHVTDARRHWPGTGKARVTRRPERRVEAPALPAGGAALTRRNRHAAVRVDAHGQGRRPGPTRGDPASQSTAIPFVPSRCKPATEVRVAQRRSLPLAVASGRRRRRRQRRAGGRSHSQPQPTTNNHNQPRPTTTNRKQRGGAAPPHEPARRQSEHGGKHSKRPSGSPVHRRDVSQFRTR